MSIATPFPVMVVASGNYPNNSNTNSSSSSSNSSSNNNNNSNSSSSSSGNNTRNIVVCTPAVFEGSRMKSYIENQRRSTRKQWIFGIVDGTLEVNDRLIDNSDYVLLPDTEALNTSTVVNWLVVFKDLTLHTIRDLDASHIEMLERCKRECVQAVCERTHHTPNNVIAYFHYLPSVFQLHLHVCAPYGQYTTLDVCKIHPIDNVISNLRIDPEYYRKAHITTVVMGRGELLDLFMASGSELPLLDSA